MSRGGGGLMLDSPLIVDVVNNTGVSECPSLLLVR